MLAAFSFYDDNPFLINEIQDRFYDIDYEQILNVIDNYLNKANRNILFVKPGAWIDERKYNWNRWFTTSKYLW